MVEHTFLNVSFFFGTVCVFWIQWCHIQWCHIQWCHIQHLSLGWCRGRWDSSRSTRTSCSSSWNGGQGDGKACQTYRVFITRRSRGHLKLFAKVQEPRWWMEWRKEGMNEWMNEGMYRWIGDGQDTKDGASMNLGIMNVGWLICAFCYLKVFVACSIVLELGCPHSTNRSWMNFDMTNTTAASSRSIGS